MQRTNEPELIDLGSAYYTKEEYEGCLHQLGRIGRFLGNNATLKAFHRFTAPSSILDVGCGGGQFTMHLAQEFPRAKIVGIDISSEAIAFANSLLRQKPLPNVTFEVASFDQSSYTPNSVDAVTATLVCHHLKDDELIAFLKNAYQAAAKFVILNDLHRHRMAYLSFATVIKPFFRNRLIYHDGLLSIKRAFKKQEWINYLTAAKIPLSRCTITWHWAFRWIVCIDTSAKNDK